MDVFGIEFNEASLPMTICHICVYKMVFLTLNENKFKEPLCKEFHILHYIQQAFPLWVSQIQNQKFLLGLLLSKYFKILNHDE